MTHSKQVTPISRRTFLQGVAVLAGGTVVQAACGPAATQAPAEKVKIGLSLPSQAQYRWQFDEQYFREAIARLGAEVIVQSANDDETLQASQVENMLAQGIDALVLSPVNSAAAGALVDTAAQQNVPVVSYNMMAMNTGNLDFWVARSNIQVGHITAELALQAFPQGHYVIASGDPGNDVAQDKTKGYLEILQPAIDSGQIEVTSQEYHRGWDPALGLAQVENALTATGNDIQAVLGNYDGFALSALQALREQGLEGQVWVGGEDVFPEAAQAIVEGRMAMSAFTDLKEMANKSADAAVALAKGETPSGDTSRNNGVKDVPGNLINAFAVTKDNMPDFISDFEGWVDYDEVYANIPQAERP